MNSQSYGKSFATPILILIFIFTVFNPAIAATENNISEVNETTIAPFINCAAQTQIPLAECNALTALYNSTNGANWSNHTGWMQTDTPCGWYGVTCSTGHVNDIFLTANHLTGSIPPEIGSLTGLERLHLDYNVLTGNIPSQVGNLINMTDLGLSFNDLSGSIPPQLGSLSNLTELILSGNNLDGSIPAQLGSLPNLTTLAVDQNPLTGSLPPELGKLAKLVGLYIANTQLTGSLPAEFGSLTNLHDLHLQNNYLTGSLPAELGNLTKLETLLLEDNYLEGEIPASITKLSALTVLRLPKCDLTSTDLDVIAFINYLMPGWQSDLCPKVLSIERVGSSPTSASLVDFTVTFTESVTGVNTRIPFDDFFLTTTGVTGAAITGVNGSDDSYTVTVNTGSKDGTIRLDVKDDNSILDSANNPLGGNRPGDGDFTSGEGYKIDKSTLPFTDCGSQSQIPLEECDALVALYDSTNGAGWTNHTRWLETNTLCNWFGVTCSAGHVTELNLYENNLTGSISPEIGDLKNLARLNLSSNSLSGTIPEELGGLAKLVRLNLGTNSLTGSIPVQLGSLGNLRRLELFSNRLTGSIPMQLGSLTNLTYLRLEYNELTGGIPAELGNLTSLIDLSLIGNRLTGSIPPQLGNLKNLTHFDVSSGNRLTGTIPPELGKLTNLVTLGLSENPLTGRIPSELGNLTKLNSLYIFGTQLSGNIPSELGNLTNLEYLYLDNNRLTGGIPAQLGNLTKLKILILEKNNLWGEIPVSITNMVSLTDLRLACGVSSTNPDVIAFLEKKLPGWQNNRCPVVASVTRKDPDPTSASSVFFTVTFSESVTGLDLISPFEDFVLVTSGVSGAHIEGVSGSDSSYSVKVNTGSRSGTIQLQVKDNNSIENRLMNSLGGPSESDGDFTSGKGYTVTKIGNIDLTIGKDFNWRYVLNPSQHLEVSQAETNDGPVVVENLSLDPMLASQRVLYGGVSYSEMMGLPFEQLSQEYWFPYYNNVTMSSQLRVSNLGAGDTTITVYLAGDEIDSFTLAGGAAERKNYANANNGPLQVTSSDTDILATVRVLYGGMSYSELVGLPVEQLSKEYWYPIYDNSMANSQLRVSNLGVSPTTINVYLADKPAPIDSYILQAGEASRKSYPYNTGPLRVVSSEEPILSTIRLLYKNRSFAELMGVPVEQLSRESWYPVYDNLHVNSQLRVSNAGDGPTTVTVYAGGRPVESFGLPAGQSIRKTYAGMIGPLGVISNQEPIVSSIRMLYTTASFSSLYELMGMPGAGVTTQYFFPWYNNVAMNSELRFAIP